jgi:uncharacterized repeat protein (TIGR01451 family)
MAAYVLMALALFAGLIAGPRAWATPAQMRSDQGITVPTKTPVDEPDDEPEPTSEPPPATVAPEATPAATATPAAALALTKRANRIPAWRGQTVTFTLVLKNTGQASARQVSLEDTLPAGLEPGPVHGTGAAWNGRTLAGQMPVLPPGGEFVVAFDAVVRADAEVGGLLVNVARASAAGGLSARARAFVALPPAELPAVGGD